ncbi:hypothetical protein [Chryseobacterium mucoviscidosis]|uniref:hypothetical protein n=1 Tax=Chryseobacterium mucoviscidosis TaxID=1945581 RepID=UPI0031E14845
MENEKLRVNLTVGELELLFDLLKKHGTDEALQVSDRLTTTNYIIKKTSFDDTRFSHWDVVINIISVAMKINSTLLAPNYPLFHPPVMKLRARLNQYISSRGGRSYLIDNDIKNNMTVQALYDLVINKIQK